MASCTRFVHEFHDVGKERVMIGHDTFGVGFCLGGTKQVYTNSKSIFIYVK